MRSNSTKVDLAFELLEPLIAELADCRALQQIGIGPIPACLLAFPIALKRHLIQHLGDITSHERINSLFAELEARVGDEDLCSFLVGFCLEGEGLPPVGVYVEDLKQAVQVDGESFDLVNRRHHAQRLFQGFLEELREVLGVLLQVKEKFKGDDCYGLEAAGVH